MDLFFRLALLYRLNAIKAPNKINLRSQPMANGQKLMAALTYDLRLTTYYCGEAAYLRLRRSRLELRDNAILHPH